MKLNDKQALQLLRTRIQTALFPLEVELDVNLRVGNCSFDPTGNNCTFKLEVAAKREDGTVVSKEAEDFKRFAKLEGFSPSDLGRKFISNGSEFEVCGYKARSYKRPILAKEIRTGKIYKFTSESIRIKFGIKSPNLING
jgi:hypothetical protein